MDMKVAAQHAALQYELNKMGYQCMLNEGTTLTAALVRSQYSASTNPEKAASLFYNQMIFGALQKFTYPLHNLLAAAKKCTAYDISTSAKTVMILPHGTPEMMSLTKAENMMYNVNGLTGPQGDAVSLELQTGYKIPASNASVFVHIPPPTHVHGAAAPHARKSELQREVQMYLLYKMGGTAGKSDAYCALDHKTGTLPEITQTTPTEIDSASKTPKAVATPETYEMRLITINMMSGIIAVPGEETGNLIMQYPRSTVATDASTESGRMMLRVLMGVVCKRPENILVLEDISCAGVKSCNKEGEPALESFENKDKVTDKIASLADAYTKALSGTNVTFNGIRCYIGNHFDAAGDLKVQGNSPLGNLDDPKNLHKLHGMQVFDPTMSAPTVGGESRAAMM